MAGKSARERKKRAKVQKRERDQLKQKKNSEVVAQIAKSEAEQLEEAKRQAVSEAEALEPEPKLLCPLCGKPSKDGGIHDECADREAMKADLGEAEPTALATLEKPEVPFDPKKLVADILKKKDGE